MSAYLLNDGVGGVGVGFRLMPAGLSSRKNGSRFVFACRGEIRRLRIAQRKMLRIFGGQTLRVVRGKSGSFFHLVSGVWEMPRQSTGICRCMRLCFQGGGGATAC
ncbi:hypothetical protein, partial [Mesorhizobium sp. M7D.F.Ca.US.004.03.1.1]|uniref:hypothetical protein n=1 Tax=Mesorhizobium sp. M7D.F.Ca.US.004.03.1.1 TaxID=2496702 RepID=UPI0013E32111